MSGGHFEYKQYYLEDIASSIDELIASNETREEWLVDEWGEANNFPEDILEKFREAARTLRAAGKMAQRVDWLVSGDDGEESFRNRWKEEVENGIN